MEHMLVLRHYGRRMLPPDPRRAKGDSRLPDVE